jgi:hypothetical protein
VVRLLLDKGADEQSRTHGLTPRHRGMTPRQLATNRQHVEVVNMLAYVGIRRAQCVAFAMGHHERLGAGSRVLALDAGVVRMVLEQV